jgi:hypothetical protein
VAAHITCRHSAAETGANIVNKCLVFLETLFTTAHQWEGPKLKMPEKGTVKKRTCATESNRKIEINTQNEASSLELYTLLR